MAWSASKIFVATEEDIRENTTALDYNSDTFKNALYDNDITPDQTVASANTAYGAGQWVASGNEVTSTGEWDTGGVALASVTSAFSSNVYTFDAADTASSAGATITGAFGCLVYDDTIATPVADQGICYNYFGGSQSVSGGLFTVVWSASGIFAITY
jgi:hypothetical protein